jgi:hypothetical protein
LESRSRAPADRPRLTVTVLRLDTGTFHTLAEGTEPAGGGDLTAWTAAVRFRGVGQFAELLRSMECDRPRRPP